MIGKIASAWLAVLLCASAAAGEDEVAHYRPQPPMTGVIRSWGHGFLKEMMRIWEDGFRQYHPGITFEDTLLSSAAGMAGLYSGRADIGIVAREITPPEIAAYEKFTGQKIAGVTVLTGSYGNPDKIMALGIFVNAKNPLNGISSAEAASVFGVREPSIRRWDQLGHWSKSKIHTYSGLAFEAPAAFFSKAVLGGSVIWNSGLTELGDVAVPGGKDLDGYQRVIEAVAADPYGIAIAGAGYRHPGAKLLAVDGVYPSLDHVQDRSYKLSRSVKFYINNGPAIPADPKVVEFLRFVLSAEGQSLVAREGDFLSLTPELARTEREKLPPPDAIMTLAGRVAIPAMHGTFDHLAADESGNRFFLSAQDDHAVDIVDLGSMAPLHRVQGSFNRPQGEIYLPDLNALVVSNGRDGSVKILDGATLAVKHDIALSLGADMMTYDARRHELFAESGGTDSNRGPGKISVIDPRSGEILAAIETGFRAAALAMTMDRDRPRLYAAIPAADQVAVIDTRARAIEARFETPGRPAALTLDEGDHRLIVATRRFQGDPRSPTITLVDAETGASLAALPIQDGVESMSFDPELKRVYATGLEGLLQVYAMTDRDHLSLAAEIPTGAHAGTSEFLPRRRLLCVAVPPHHGQYGELRVYKPLPAAVAGDRDKSN